MFVIPHAGALVMVGPVDTFTRSEARHVARWLLGVEPKKPAVVCSCGDCLGCEVRAMRARSRRTR